MSHKISIVGAGLVGSLLSIHLRQKGFDVTIFDKRKDPRTSKNYEGRSINLALSRRGILALEAVGVFRNVEPLLIPMKGRMMHNECNELTFQAYGKEGQHINSVSRGQLNRILIEAAEALGVKVLFEKKCEHVDFERSTLLFQDKEEVKSDVIFGTDGAFSAVRKQFQSSDRFNFSQHYIEHGYKELEIAPDKKGNFALSPDYLHIWPRGNFMLIALPNQNKTFTCTLFFPYEGSPSFESIVSQEDTESFFRRYFPDLLSLIPDLVQQYQRNPTSSLVTTKCSPWHKNNTLMLGDACHAIVPFYGQGMNSGFEDVRLFMELAESQNWNWDQIIPSFSSIRKKDADAISELALSNFIEMRDHVGNPSFLKRKKLEAQIQEAYPKDWIPLYSMVTFSDLPYSEALRLGNIQNKIMNKVIDKKIEDISFDEIVKEFNTLKKAD